MAGGARPPGQACRPVSTGPSGGDRIPGLPGGGAAGAEAGPGFHHGAKKRQIRSTTIEDFIADNNIPLDKHLVVKMDVEGAEVEILQSSFEIYNGNTTNKEK